MTSADAATPPVTPDFHTGVLTIAASVIIAVAFKRYRNVDPFTKIERFCFLLALPTAVLVAGAALTGLLTQTTTDDTAAMMTLFTLLSLVFVTAPFLVHFVIIDSPIAKDVRDLDAQQARNERKQAKRKPFVKLRSGISAARKRAGSHPVLNPKTTRAILQTALWVALIAIVVALVVLLHDHFITALEWSDSI